MIRAAIAQIDHLHGYAEGGLTDAANGKIDAGTTTSSNTATATNPNATPTAAGTSTAPTAPDAPPDAA